MRPDRRNVDWSPTLHLCLCIAPRQGKPKGILFKRIFWKALRLREHNSYRFLHHITFLTRKKISSSNNKHGLMEPPTDLQPSILAAQAFVEASENQIIFSETAWNFVCSLDMGEEFLLNPGAVLALWGQVLPVPYLSPLCSLPARGQTLSSSAWPNPRDQWQSQNCDSSITTPPALNFCFSPHSLVCF